MHSQDWARSTRRPRFPFSQNRPGAVRAQTARERDPMVPRARDPRFFLAQSGGPAKRLGNTISRALGIRGRRAP